MSELNELLFERKKKLEQLRMQILKDIRSSPEGSLRVLHKSGGPQYYLSVPELSGSYPKGKYLKKKEVELAAAIARRDYGQRMLKMIDRQLVTLSKFKSLSDNDLYRIYEEECIGRKILITPYLISDEAYLEKWLSTEYKGKEFSESAPEFYSNTGVRVRSKSEKIIADHLTDRKIPYHYEKPLFLGKITVYPDFTILDLSHRKEIYYEHFGRMDDPTYADNAVQKINAYAKAGFILGDSLIATFETKDHPLDSGVLRNTFEKYVLAGTLGHQV